jgi:hypothetical protein
MGLGVKDTGSQGKETERKRNYSAERLCWSLLDLATQRAKERQNRMVWFLLYFFPFQRITLVSDFVPPKKECLLPKNLLVLGWSPKRENCKSCRSCARPSAWRNITGGGHVRNALELFLQLCFRLPCIQYSFEYLFLLLRFSDIIWSTRCKTIRTWSSSVVYIYYIKNDIQWLYHSPYQDPDPDKLLCIQYGESDDLPFDW